VKQIKPLALDQWFTYKELPNELPNELPWRGSDEDNDNDFDFQPDNRCG
jgi:hypothetical protein